MSATPRSAVRRLAVARVISYTGGAAAFTALMYEIYRQTNSSAWLAAALILTFGITGLVSPLAGVLGDRFDRRRVMIWSDLAGAACFGAMALLHAPVPLLAVAFLAAIAEAPFRFASTAAVPNLVADPEDLGWANGLLAMGANAGILLGPPLGGVLVATIGASWVFGLNAVSFVISAAIVRSVRGRFAEDRRPDAAVQQGIRAGFRFLLHERVLRLIALAWVAIVLGGGFCMVADVPLATEFGTGALGYGLMIAGWGGGSMLGSLAGRWMKEPNEPAVLVAGAVIMAFGTAATAVSPWFAPVVVLIFVAGFGDAIMQVAYQNALQRRTPDAVRSRVSAAIDAGVQIALAVSFAAGGIAVAAVGPRGAYLVGGATALAAVSLLIPIRRIARSDASAAQMPAAVA